jgi:DNA modification methylase
VGQVSKNEKPQPKINGHRHKVLEVGASALYIPTVSGQTQNGNKWTLHQGDSPEVLRQLPTGSVNCIVTSPPYFWQRDYGVKGQLGHEPTIGGYVQALVSCFREAKRVLRDDGVFFLNIGDTFYSAKGKPHGRDKKNAGRQWSRTTLRAVDGPGLGLPRKSLIGIPWRVALAMQDDGWTLRSDVVWKRPGALPEPTAHDRPWMTHEHVFIFSKQPKYWFDRKPIAGEEDIWHVPPRPDSPGAHFAPFPSALVEKCIRCGCPDGGTVLDPFAGSGTSLVVALGLNRNAVGIELKREYCDYIVGRIRLALAEPQAPSVTRTATR